MTLRGVLLLAIHPRVHRMTFHSSRRRINRVFRANGVAAHQGQVEHQEHRQEPERASHRA